MLADSSRAPLERFSSRVANYVRFRPGYPPAVISLLQRCCGLAPGAVVADVGAGTGIFTAALLASGATVHALEPNAKMRAAAAAYLGARPRLTFGAGRAEATGLAAASCRLVTAAQAFHWFDAGAARAEFARILAPEGWVALIWNWRRADGSPFLADYEALLRAFSPEYVKVAIEHWDEERIVRFFAPGCCRQARFPHHQALDGEALRGRLLSASYAPAPTDPRYQPMLEELGRLFARHQQHGLVRLDYDARVFYGRLR